LKQAKKKNIALEISNILSGGFLRPKCDIHHTSSPP
jgi:hypothetical protein